MAMFSISLSCLWICVITPTYTGSLLLRLSGESSACQGMVQMQSMGRWLPVCGDFWSSTLTLITCKKLGCGRPERPSNSPIVTANQTSLFLNISCSHEDLLENCNVSQIPLCNRHVILSCTDPQSLRLSGGESRCAGRVELFRDGTWGSVCDDGWDALDAHVTCQQLGCGSALQALGASHFGSGPSKIHLNEVNCSGAEHHLWECPARAKHNYNCTAEEHAGVICVEHKAVRVFGGSNQCSGRVEVYMGGVWGTVCDSHWFDDDADMLCRTLGCGPFMSQTSHDHSLSSYMGFLCKNATSLWDCAVYHKNRNFCWGSRALGVVCRGLSTPEPSAPAESTTGTATGLPALGPDTGVVDTGNVQWYMTGLCVALAVLLLTSIIIFILIIWQLRRQQRISFQSVSRPSANEYRESSFTLDKSPGLPFQMSAHRDTTRSRQPVPVAIPNVPPEVADAPCDDYEFASLPPVPLITFHDSFQRQPELRVSQEDHVQVPWGETLPNQQKSVWSSRSSSTSSEEQNWYENYRRQRVNQDLTPPPQSHAGSSEYDDVNSTGSG